MEKVLLATPEAYDGIENFEGRQGCISDNPETMAGEALRWLDEPCAVRVPEARVMVLSDYDWDRNLDTYESVLRNVRSDSAQMDTAGNAGLEAYS